MSTAVLFPEGFQLCLTEAMAMLLMVYQGLRFRKLNPPWTYLQA